ncbi:hypothetical protein [Isoptericola sp. NPDC060257]|uniref:hypothetical protein n=1 Tax=Isoptericola sp. NPDC060257 TaxID=3347087 RepID=UPI003662E709
MPAPSAEQVAGYLGKADEVAIVSLAQQHLPIVTAFVRAYVRGNGFADSEPNADLEAVIVSACARLTANPEQVSRYQTADYAENPAVLHGFTLPELAILHLYRRRTA